MNHKENLFRIFLAVALAYPVLAQNKPNFVFILVDDMGWMDLGVQGSEFYLTPHIDKLAADGMRFTNGYAAHPVCSPSRAAVMTGKNPGRLQITQWIGGRDHGVPYVHEMKLTEVTIAEAMKEGGYSTAFLGKWHLSEPDSAYYPDLQGFDVNVGGWRAGSPSWSTGNGYFSPYGNPFLSDGPNGEYLTDRLTDEAMSWIETNRSKPFFVYLSYYNIHTPLQAKQNKINYYTARRDSMYANSPAPPDRTDMPRGGKAKMRQDNPTMGAMIEHVDENIGRLRAKLNELNLTDNTVFLFTSDNGGLARPNGPTSSAPLKAGKGWLYEGGVRVPYIISWPGKTQPGSVTQQVGIGMDFYPTILEMAGLPFKPQQHADGRSLVSVLNGGNTFDRDVYFHYPHTHDGNTGTTAGSAIRLGDYKLVEWMGDDTFELYKIDSDSGELVNIASSEPEMANLLRWKLKEWRDSVGANMPAGWNPSVPITTPNIQGCTDPQADNFNVYATVDNNSCQMGISYGRIGYNGQPNISVTENTFQIEFLENSHFDISLQDLQGKEIYRWDGVGNKFKTIIPHIFSGIYYLAIFQNDKTFYKKIFLQKNGSAI